MNKYISFGLIIIVVLFANSYSQELFIEGNIGGGYTSPSAEANTKIYNDATIDVKPAPSIEGSIIFSYKPLKSLPISITAGLTYKNNKFSLTFNKGDASQPEEISRISTFNLPAGFVFDITDILKMSKSTAISAGLSGKLQWRTGEDGNFDFSSFKVLNVNLVPEIKCGYKFGKEKKQGIIFSFKWDFQTSEGVEDSNKDFVSFKTNGASLSIGYRYDIIK